jgi:hypothetical protein
MRNNIPVPVVIGTVAGWGFIVTVTSGRFHLIRGVDFEKLVERRSRDKGWAVHCTLLPRAIKSGHRIPNSLEKHRTT